MPVAVELRPTFRMELGCDSDSGTARRRESSRAFSYRSFTVAARHRLSGSSWSLICSLCRQAEAAVEACATGWVPGCGGQTPMLRNETAERCHRSASSRSRREEVPPQKNPHIRAFQLPVSSAAASVRTGAHGVAPRPAVRRPVPDPAGPAPAWRSVWCKAMRPSRGRFARFANW